MNIITMFLALLAAGTPVINAVAEPLAFEVETVAEQHSGDCKAIADFNGDGRNDIAIGGYTLVWYRSPTWTATLIATADIEFTTDMETVDMDGDGDADLVVPDGTTGVYWYENRNAGQAWTPHLIGSSLGLYSHDVEVGDIDGDGDFDVVSRSKDGPLRVFRNDGGIWASNSMATTGGEGLCLKDLEGNGHLDIVVNGQWHRSPSGDILGGDWQTYVYDADALNHYTKVEVADLDGDCRPDIALTPSESPGRIIWYHAPKYPLTGTWVETVLHHAADHFHSLILIDLDRNGWCDLVTAQMHTTETGPVIEVFRNFGPAVPWERQILAGDSSHNMVAGDLDGDGRPDLAGCNFIGSPPIKAWMNRTPFSGPVATPAVHPLTLAVAPNPFNAHLMLNIEAPVSTVVSLRIYDLGGRLVRVLLADEPFGNPRMVIWNGRSDSGTSVPSGTYYALLTASGARLTRSISLVK